MEKSTTYIIQKNGSIIKVAESYHYIDDFPPTVYLLFLITLTGIVLNTILAALCFRKNRRKVACWAVIADLDCLINYTTTLITIMSEEPVPDCRVYAWSSILWLLLNGATATFFIWPSEKIWLLVLLLIFKTIIITPLLFVYTIPVRYFVNRYTCGIGGDNIIFSISLLIFGFLIPWSAMIHCIFALILSKPPFSNLSEHYTQKEKQLSISIIFIYFLCILPHSVMVMVTAFTVTIDFKIIPTNKSMLFVETSDLDKIFIWLRYLYNISVPILIFFMLPDLREEVKEIWKILTSKRKNISKVSDFKNYSDLAAVPVLFSTFNGLVLRTKQFDDNGNLLRNFSFLFCDHSKLFNCSNSKPSNPLSCSNTIEKNKTQNQKVVRFAQIDNTSR